MTDLDLFARYLYALWNDHEFTHSYRPPPKGMWKESLDDGLWSCTGLKSARDLFVWSSNAEDFERLSEGICFSVQSGDEKRTRDLCIDILNWGGVGKAISDPSKLWIDTKFKKGELTEKLRIAVKNLNSAAGDLDDFDGVNLPMNSGMTKIYAASDPTKKTLIYDGRVGAALCFLVKNFLIKNGTLDVPSALQFRWGRSKDGYIAGARDKRDPRDSSFSFPQLFTTHRKDWNHASCSRRFNILAEYFCSTAAINGENVAGTDLERSLFMIGYDLRGEGKK